MIVQLVIGAGITFASTLIAAGLWWGLRELMTTMRARAGRLRVLIELSACIVTAMAIMTIGIWLWAIVFLALNVLPTLEGAIYYALVAYTTLGLGDQIIPVESRLLAGMIGANGFLIFGVLTSMVTDTLRDIRRPRT